MSGRGDRCESIVSYEKSDLVAIRDYFGAFEGRVSKTLETRADTTLTRGSGESDAFKRSSVADKDVSADNPVRRTLRRRYRAYNII